MDDILPLTEVLAGVAQVSIVFAGFAGTPKRWPGTPADDLGVNLANSPRKAHSQGVAFVRIEI